MIYTLTLNPAIDMNVMVEDMEFGKVNRTKNATYSANGKGLNVSYTLRHFGVESGIIGFFGGFSGEYIMDTCKEKGYKVGIIRPITLWPFPFEAFEKALSKSTDKTFLAVEMSMGQMVEDVRLAVNGRANVEFFGRTGGIVPTPKEILEKIEEIGGAK